MHTIIKTFLIGCLYIFIGVATSQGFAKWKSIQAIEALKDAGLEAEGTYPMEAKDYGLAPFVGEGTRFLIPSLGEDTGGRAFALDTEEHLEMLRSYYVKLGEASAIFSSHICVKDNILVQITNSLEKAKADLYCAALETMD